MLNQIEPVVVKAAALSAAATTKTIDLFKLPAGGYWLVSDVILERITDFVGGSISALTVEVGVSGTAAAYLAASDVFTGAKATAKFASGAGASVSKVVAGGTTIQLKATATGANTSVLTAGELAVSFNVAQVAVKE
jgi:hypothetical protein